MKLHLAITTRLSDLGSGLDLLRFFQKVLSDSVRPLCSHYGAVVGLHTLGWKAMELFTSPPCVLGQPAGHAADYSVYNAQVKADGHKVYGATLVAVECLLKMKAVSASACLRGLQLSAQLHGGGYRLQGEPPGPQLPPEPLWEETGVTPSAH